MTNAKTFQTTINRKKDKMDMKHFSQNETRFFAVSDDDGHSFSIATGHDFEERFNKALREHYDGDVEIKSDLMNMPLGVDNNFHIEIDIIRDGEIECTTDVYGYQTWVY